MSRRHPLRVLLLTRFYPPAPEVGGLRPANLVRALRAAGHEVTVVTALPPAATRPEQQRGDTRRSQSTGVRTVCVERHLGPRQWLMRGTRLLLSGATAERTDGNAPTSPSDATAPREVDESLATRLRALVLSYPWLPDDHQGLIFPAVRTAVDEAERAPYDVIVATAPPFSTLPAGVAASTLTGSPLVIEYRDPWNYGDDPLPHLHSSADRLNRWLERFCLRHATEVVAVTEQTGALLAGHRGALGKAAPLVIRNGIDVVRSDRSGARGDTPVRIVHVGAL